MANNRPMTEDEKKLLQAQHRMEAIEARNRQKERKANTSLKSLYQGYRWVKYHRLSAKVWNPK